MHKQQLFYNFLVLTVRISEFCGFFLYNSISLNPGLFIITLVKEVKELNLGHQLYF